MVREASIGRVHMSAPASWSRRNGGSSSCSDTWSPFVQSRPSRQFGYNPVGTHTPEWTGDMLLLIAPFIFEWLLLVSQSEQWSAQVYDWMFCMQESAKVVGATNKWLDGVSPFTLPKTYQPGTKS